MAKNKAVNLNSLLDTKLPNIVNVIKDASSDMLNSAESIANTIKRIQEEHSKINNELQDTLATEKDTEESAQAKALQDTNTKIVPELRRIGVRLERLTKNNKAILGLLNAASALYVEPEEE